MKLDFFVLYMFIVKTYYHGCMPLASFPISEGFVNGAVDACVAIAVVCIGGGFWFWSAIVIGASLF